MAGQIRRLSRGQVKPYNSLPQIDWSHPLAAGLATYCYSTDGSIIDLVIGTQFIKSGGAPGAGLSQFGRGLSFGLTDFGAMPPFPVNYINPFGGAAPFSCAVGTIFNTTAMGPGSPDCASVNVQAASNNEDTFFGFNVWPAGASGNPSSSTVCSFVVNNTFNVFPTPPGTQAGVQPVVANTFQSWGFVASTSSHGLTYYNGVNCQEFDSSSNTVNSAYTGTTTFSGDTQAQTMYNTASINAGQTFGNGISGIIPYFAMWGRALTAAEMLLLYEDPYCFLIYPEDRIFSTLVGAGGLILGQQSLVMM